MDRFTEQNYTMDGDPQAQNRKLMGYQSTQTRPGDELLRFASINIDVCIKPQDRQKISQELSVLLADTYLLYLKTHNYHWNITGPLFLTLHELFMKHYLEMALAVDLIAERIRSLGFPAPATFVEFNNLTTLKEEPGVKNAERMITELCQDQEAVMKTIRNVVRVAEAAADLVTVDLLTTRLKVHEKNAWILRSFLNA